MINHRARLPYRWDYKVNIIDGVSKSKAKVLRQAGIIHVYDLALTDHHTIKDLPGFGPKLAEKVVKQAREVLR